MTGMAGGVEIAGVRAALADPRAALADLQAFARARGGWAQLLDAGRVLGRDHVVSAFEHASRAFGQGTNSTGSLEVELLLYVSGERQISKAIDLAGVKARRPFVVVCGGVRLRVLLDRAGWRADDRVVRATPAKLRSLGFPEAAIRSAGARATDLVLERVARVDLVK